MKIGPSGGDVLVSLVIIGAAFVAGVLCAIAGAAVAYASIARCGA